MGTGQTGDYSERTIRRRLGDELASIHDDGGRLTLFAHTVTGDTPDADAEAGFSGLKRFLGKGRRLFQPPDVKHAFDAMVDAEDLMAALKLKRKKKIDDLRGTLGVSRMEPDPSDPKKFVKRWKPLTDAEKRRLNRNNLHTDELNGMPISTVHFDKGSGNYLPDGQYAVHKKELEQIDTQLEAAAQQARTQRKHSTLPDRRRNPGGVKWGKAALWTLGAGGAWWLGNQAMQQYQDGKLSMPNLGGAQAPEPGSVSSDWAGRTAPPLPGQEPQQPQSGSSPWSVGSSGGFDSTPITPAPMDIFGDDEEDNTDYYRDITDTGTGDFEYRGGSGEGLKRFAQAAKPPEEAEVEAKNAAEALLAPYGHDPLNMIVAMMNGAFGEVGLDEAKSTMPDFEARANKVIAGMQTMAKALGDISQRIESSTNIDFDHLQQEAEREKEAGPALPRAAQRQ